MSEGNDDKDKPLRVEFAPGVLEALENELSPEDLQAFMDDFKNLIESGRIFEESTPVDFDKLEHDEPEVYEALLAAMNNVGLGDDGDIRDVDLEPAIILPRVLH